MKRYLLLVNAMLISVAFSGAHTYSADKKAWRGDVKRVDEIGGIYSISTAEELAWVAQQSQTDDFRGKTIRLEADIDLGGAQDAPPAWTPIGSAEVPFCGDFNGNNHVIYNLYMLSSLFPKGAGLFAATGETAVVHHLGLAQGQIMTDGSNNVGGLAGINRGKLHHCFNMLQLIAHNGNNVGGLAGTNYGEIAYCYNTGIISDAFNYAGGLVGMNMSSGVLRECYNTAYCKSADHAGALFGKNEAPSSQLSRLYFDQQVSRSYVTGYGASDALDNLEYAIDKTSVFFSEENPFIGLPEWLTERDGEYCYPRLACFGEHEASLVSTAAIRLNELNPPTERAEGVGSPSDGNKPRPPFIVNGAKGTKWYSPSQEAIKIEYETFAHVTRSCSNQEVILTATLGKATKQIYTIVKGYETFDAGFVSGQVIACWNEENVGFKANNREGREATGGKDDEQESETLSYRYMIIRDTVITISEDEKEFIPMDTAYFNQKTYGECVLRTDIPGEYAFRRYVHDHLCRTDWLASQGRLFLSVREKIEPGLLVEKPDTLFAVFPTTLTIASAEDARGGGGVFRYQWKLERKGWDAEKREWQEPGEDDRKNPLYIDGSPVKTSSFDFTFTQPGQYTFTRSVTEESCEAKPMVCPWPHVVVVYEAINAGFIEDFERYLCTPEYLDTVQEKVAATGGDGSYTYRWLCNGEVVENSDTTALPLDFIPMERGKSYVFTRQVRDKGGRTEWVNSKGRVKITVLSDFGEAWRLGLAEKEHVPVAICAEDFPHDYVYTFSDGHSERFSFASGGQRFTLDDVTPEGCPLEVTLESELIPMPAVEVQPVVSVCQTASHLTIVYGILNGSPNRFDLTFSPLAKEAGFRDSIGAFLPSNDSIFVPLPNHLVLGEQEMELVFYTDETVPESCRRSAPQRISFSIDLDGYVRRKGEDILYVDNSGRHTDESLVFVSYQWYRDGEKLSDETDQFLYEYPSPDGVYQVEMTTEDGTVYRSCLYDVRRDKVQGTKDEGKVQRDDVQCTKVIRDGKLYLMYKGTMYDVQGRRVGN